MYIRNAIAKQKYNIENYLIEAYKISFSSLKDLTKKILKEYKKHSKNEYEHNMLKRFPEINIDKELINSAGKPYKVNDEYKIEYKKRNNDWLNYVAITPVEDLPNLISWVIGSTMHVSPDLYNIADDCPPIPKNKWGCVYRRVYKPDGEPSIKCRKTCNITPVKK